MATQAWGLLSFLSTDTLVASKAVRVYKDFAALMALKRWFKARNIELF